ncbi:hypothetical protein C8J57DRAFT_1467017, partial [Mycena rebaudengoi]
MPAHIPLGKYCGHTKCGSFYWHNPPTAIGNIPENVSIRFTLKKSAEEVGTSLLCDVSCLTAENKRRRADKECTRTIPKCAACCRAAGGCNTPSHRIKHRDVPASLLEQTQPSSSQKFADPQAGPSVGSDEDTTVIRRTFARPLDEGYAKNYISSHRQLLDDNAKMEAVQRLKDLTTNSIHVVLWTKVNYPPQHFRLVNSQPGKFVPQEHAIVMAAAELEAAGFIQHLAVVYPSPLWVVHDARLQRENSPSQSAIAQAHRLLALSSSSTRNSSPEPPSSSKSSPAPPESREPADDKREMRPLPFPLKNACDMQPSMRALSVLRKSTQRLSVSALSNAFLTQPSFKNCRFKNQTVYKHLRIYNDAVAADIPLSGDTKWADIVKQVEALNTAVTESTALQKTIIDNEDEDGLGFDVKNLKLEIYKRFGGILETSSPPDSYIDVIVLDQYAPGKRMRVHMAQYTANGTLKTIALKKIFLPGQWFDLWHNKTVATWVEGARLAECGILWQAFASRVRAVDIDLIGVEVLETFHSARTTISTLPNPGSAA